MNQDKHETIFERAVKGWTDLSRRSISDANRLATSLSEAGSKLMLDTTRTFGEWASQVSEAAGKARELVAREGEAGKSRGQVVTDIASRIGSAYSTAWRGYGQAVRKSVEHFTHRFGDRDASKPEAEATESAEPAAPRTEA